MKRLLLALLCAGTTCGQNLWAMRRADVAARPAEAPERKVFAHFMGCWPAAHGALPHTFLQESALTPEARRTRARRNGYEAVGGRIVNWPLVPQGFETNALANAKLEIARAIRAGIDGFAFDAWAGGDSAKRQLDTFFRAAEEM